MDLFPPRGRVRRVSSPVRRRTGRFALPLVESLEPRQLLAAGPLGLNVEIDPFFSFVNLLQDRGRWNDYASETSSVVYNASGDPEGDASLILDYRVNEPFNGPDPNAVGPDLSGTYHLSFNGQATITTDFPEDDTPFTVQNQTYNAATNTTTANIVVPTGLINPQELFILSLLDTRATATSAVNTGFSNAKLIRPGYDPGSTQVYSDQFISALKPYTTLRYLDPAGINNQPFFDQNTLVTVDATQVDQTGMPWELLVALANQSHTDMWINVPQGATDDYVAALAGIIKNGGSLNGVTYAGLDPSLKIYLEYSNEVWGGIPFNEYYQNSAVQDAADNHPLSTFSSNLHVYDNTDGTTTTNVNTAVGRRYLERTADIGKIFQSVLGSDPTHQRIRPVLGWQENNSIFYPGALEWYQHFFGAASSAFYGMGNANYWSPTDYSSVDAVINSLAAQETSFSIPETVAFTTLATYYGLANVSYEGGPSLSGGEVALAASRDPRMEQLVYQHYVNYYAAGGGLANFYDGPFAIWTPQNEWGVAEASQLADPSASPKYRGVVDVANASPVAVTAGIQVATAGPTSFNATTDSLGAAFSNPYTGQQAYWMLNVASAGAYELKLTTSADASVSSGQVKVFLDDTQIGGLLGVSSTSTIDLGRLVLSAGLHSFSICVVRGSQDSSQGISPDYEFRPSTFTLMSAGPPTVGDSGFEAVNVGTNFYTAYAYNPTGSAWVFSGNAGVAGNGSGFTSNNPTALQGTQVAFLQMTGSFSQTVTGWASGTYVISFRAAQRGGGGVSHANQDFQVLVDGAVVGTFKPDDASYRSYGTTAFTVPAGSHTIEFLGLDSAGGDNTALIDSVAVVVPGPPMLGDAGFETVNVGSNFYTAYAYDPAGSAWFFSGNAGLAGNGSGFTSGHIVAPEGAQVAFLQTTGSFSQTVVGWASGTYVIAFRAAQRGGGGVSHANQDFQVLVDGAVVGTFKPDDASYRSYGTTAFTVPAGSHTIEFLGLDSAGGDNTALIDSVAVVVPGPPMLGDAGFETVNVGSNFYTAYAYDPAGSAWSFSGNAGVAGYGSGLTAINPAPPQGTQVGFVQMTGSFSQAIIGWAAGTYVIAFQAAQRGGSNGGEDFQVLLDGSVVGTFKPTRTTYGAYSTAPLVVSAGSHTIQFLGLDSAGGDNTALIDDVSIS